MRLFRLDHQRIGIRALENPEPIVVVACNTGMGPVRYSTVPHRPIQHVSDKQARLVAVVQAGQSLHDCPVTVQHQQATRLCVAAVPSVVGRLPTITHPAFNTISG